jgi:osmotically inducible protein OsmC
LQRLIQVVLRCNFPHYITEAGFEIESIKTKCDIDLVDGTILTSHLTVQAKVTGITDDAFQQLVT